MSTIRAGNTNTTAVTVTADLTGQLNLESQNGIINMQTSVGGLTIPAGTTAQRPATPTTGMLRYNTSTSTIETYTGASWITLGAVYDTDSTSTGYFDLPSGTTGQRPASPNTGYIRYNTTTSSLEVYNGSSWVAAGAVYDTDSTSTGYFQVPRGTTAQRPVTPVGGMIRYNTSNTVLEAYNGIAWTSLGTSGANYNVDYLIVAGGGGGGQTIGGGGGAGGLIQGTTSVTAATVYSISIGAGGTGAPGANGYENGGGGSGASTTALSFTAVGGGGGGNYNNNTNGATTGGSGGGMGAANSGGPMSGTAGQGNAGGVSSSNQNSGAGGGGASAVGNNATSGSPGAGGAGINWQTLGTFYAGGGGGGARNPSGGTGAAGGSSIGGTGGTGTGSGTNATANRGSGGGGGGYDNGSATMGSGGNGSSGIVIIRYAGVEARGSGGTITTSGGYVYHTFTTSGTFTA